MLKSNITAIEKKIGINQNTQSKREYTKNLSAALMPKKNDAINSASELGKVCASPYVKNELNASNSIYDGSLL